MGRYGKIDTNHLNEPKCHTEHAMKFDLNRAKGAFYGTLIGDALGAPVEFKQRNRFPQVRDMIPCEHFGLDPGSFTDDGSLMLCLAAALNHTRGDYDPYVVLCHYMEWLKNGYMSVNDEVFDVGRTTRNALMRFYATSETQADTTDDEFEAGNGSMMRLAPIPILYGADLVNLWRIAETESATTHASRTAIWCCQVLAVATALALRGSSKSAILEYVRNLEDVPECCKPIVHGEFLQETRDSIPASGWAMHTLQVVLWAFFGTETFEDGLIAVVNLGGDADTNGAVFGALAGAFYGYDTIPERWCTALQKQDMVNNVFGEFSEMARQKWESQTE